MSKRLSLICVKSFSTSKIWWSKGGLLFFTFFKATFCGFKKNVHGLNTLYHLENKILVSHATFQNGIIPLVIVEILALRLVEGCVLSRYNQLAQGDYSRSAKFRNSCLAFFPNVSGKWWTRYWQKTDSSKLGVTLSKLRCEVFAVKF